MAIKDLVSSAWQDIDTLKVPVSGAYQEADHANALVSDAWQEVWCNTIFFLQNGVVMNGAMLTTSGVTKYDGYIQVRDDSISTTYKDIITIPKNEAYIGKTLYIEYNNQQIPSSTGTGYYGYTAPTNAQLRFSSYTGDYTKMNSNGTKQSNITQHSLVLTSDMMSTEGFGWTALSIYIDIPNLSTPSGNQIGYIYVTNVYIK